MSTLKKWLENIATCNRTTLIWKASIILNLKDSRIDARILKNWSDSRLKNYCYESLIDMNAFIESMDME